MGDEVFGCELDDGGTMKAVVLNCMDVVKLNMKMKKMMTVVWSVSRMKCDRR